MKKLAIALATLAAVFGCSDKRPTLHIYTWADYIDPDVVQAFEDSHCCKVSIDTFDSNEAMFAKLKSGAAGYDLITPTSYFIDMLVENDIIQQLDTNKLATAMKSFDCRYNDKIYAPLFKYTVPYAISYGCLLYDTNKVSATDVQSYNVLLNSAYRGRMSILDDIRETIGFGLMACGYSINSESEQELEEAVEFVLKAKENIRKFDNESYKTEVANGSSYIGYGYSGDCLQVILGDGECEGRGDLAIAYPKEGFTVSCDEFAIMKDAENAELAYAFINFIYTTENCKKNMEYILALTPQLVAEDELDDDIRAALVLDEQTLKRGQVTTNFSGKKEVLELYNKMWDKIKETK